MIAFTVLVHGFIRARSRRFITITGILFVSVWLSLLLLAEATGNFAAAYLGGLAAMICVSLLLRAALRRSATTPRSKRPERVRP